MSLPCFPLCSGREQRFGKDVTRLNCRPQFKPFVYLNCRRAQRSVLVMAGLAAFPEASAAARSWPGEASRRRDPAIHRSSGDEPPGKPRGDKVVKPQKESPAFRRDLPLLWL